MTSATIGRGKPCIAWSGASRVLRQKDTGTVASGMSDSRCATHCAAPSCAAPSCDDFHTLRKLKTRSEARLNALYMKRQLCAGSDSAHTQHEGVINENPCSTHFSTHFPIVLQIVHPNRARESCSCTQGVRAKTRWLAS